MAKHIIVSEQAGSSFLKSEASPEFEKMEHAGWQGLALDQAGIFMFDIAADAVEFPMHASDLAWTAYVISGSGTLFSGSTDLAKSDSIEYQAGDFMTFEANTLHAWQSANTASRIIFVQNRG